MVPIARARMLSRGGACTWAADPPSRRRPPRVGLPGAVPLLAAAGLHGQLRALEAEELVPTWAPRPAAQRLAGVPRAGLPSEARLPSPSAPAACSAAHLRPRSVVRGLRPSYRSAKPEPARRTRRLRAPAACSQGLGDRAQCTAMRARREGTALLTNQWEPGQLRQSCQEPPGKTTSCCRPDRVRQLGGSLRAGGLLGIGATDLSTQPPLVQESHIAFLVDARVVRRSVAFVNADVPENVMLTNMSEGGGITTLPPEPSTFTSVETTVALMPLDKGGPCHCNSGWIDVTCARCNGTGEIDVPILLRQEGDESTVQCPQCRGKLFRIEQCSICCGTTRVISARTAKIVDQVKELKAIYIPSLKGKAESSLRKMLNREFARFPRCLTIASANLDILSGPVKLNLPNGSFSPSSLKVKEQLEANVHDLVCRTTSNVVLGEVRVCAWPFLQLAYKVGKISTTSLLSWTLRKL